MMDLEGGLPTRLHEKQCMVLLPTSQHDSPRPPRSSFSNATTIKIKQLHWIPLYTRR